jgi:elongation factor G
LDPALLTIAITPKTLADVDRLDRGIRQLLTEHAVVSAQTDETAYQTVVACASEDEMETALDRLHREFHVDAALGGPEVAYRETVTRRAEGEVKYAKASEGRGHYAHVRISVSPGDCGSGYVFHNTMTGDAMPARFIGPVCEGIEDVLMRGVLAGYPLVDVRVELCDGSCHETDSTDFAFKAAGAMAFAEAVQNAGPVLLEPIMQLEISVPNEHAGEVTQNLLSRRGRIVEQVDSGAAHLMRALVPMPELFGYTSDLRQRTLGRGTCSQRFHAFEPVSKTP